MDVIRRTYRPLRGGRYGTGLLGPLPYGRGSVCFRRGLILPVMLVVLVLMALLSAGFVFQIQAEGNAGRSMSDRFQSRLAAEAGVQRVMQLLRTQRDNIGAWYNNPDVFDQAVIWSPVASETELGIPALADQEEDAHALRFSIVADDPTNDDPEEETGLIRFGITDEAAKLNINVATEAQFVTLLNQVLPPSQDPESNQATALAQAIIDWRDADDQPGEFGAEGEYYASLEVPYRAKNAPYDTVEELLLVKGMTGQILYGEDYDRNGLLTPNEDDGEVSFPVDDTDGVLNRGLLPYVTVYSREFNVGNDNKPRIYLFGDDNEIRPRLMEVFDDEQIVGFILNSVREEGTERTRSLADLLEPKIINDLEVESPIRGRSATLLFDRCTLDSSPQSEGKININTAPVQVLRCIPSLLPERVPLILEKRAQLPPSVRESTAWLMTEKVVQSSNEYAAIAPHITARGRQFTVESIGFSDDSGLFTRLQVVLEMRGPLSQVIYYRDLTRLGIGFPVRGQEGERDIVRRVG